jgi:hypothetical protein
MQTKPIVLKANSKSRAFRKALKMKWSICVYLGQNQREKKKKLGFE